ncbi:hypothetical protein EW145_g1506 [Phellinidium pouzarii]|uniref:PI3K/PI4K catalytic domain-containing protein n=1 Tax=Phellinidium pouzarii TaxID=167371 RepID=A0A4S4LET7_9AGAM|nr:hypothetical protein EW145_g1506 [Phellinidium pouzarii]
MSHALLLRLFLSPSFFSINVALQYLTLYHNNIGITHYLTRRLKESDINELRDVWGFICHLLVTRPSRSRALECFVVDICERSTHMAMFTLWFMQAHIRDLALSPKDSRSFLLCQRVLHRCHEIIFEDSRGLVTGPYSTMKVRSRKFFQRHRVKHHLEPAIIGIACILAGAPGLPRLTKIIGQVAIEQGRADDSEKILRSLETEGDESPVPSPNQAPEEDEDDRDEDGQSTENAQAVEFGHSSSISEDMDGKKNRLLFKALSQSQKMREATQTTPAFSSLTSKIRHYETADDPFGQLDASSSSVPPSQSSPAISESRKSKQSGSSNLVDALMQGYDLTTQEYLLQAHYCNSEIQFILALENISNRLLVIPKPARVSALRAELTSLNHKLPAEICMPMWCTGFDAPSEAQGKPKPHHRIVRLPPGESVVLNSAERAPYLLLLEILHGDLDFNPTERGNKELLKNIIRKEIHSVKTAGGDFNPRQSSSGLPRSIPGQVSSADEALNPDVGDVEESLLVQKLTQSPVTAVNEVDDEEEVDLVEQVYGEDLSVHQTPDLSESLILPSPPKNKALDIATWSRSSSLPSSPSITPAVSNIDSHGKDLQNRSQPLQPQIFERTLSQNLSNSLRLPVLSLDEYSQRMRTAAVMLAQLNASLVKEAVVPTPRIEPPPQPPTDSFTGSLSWFSVSNWLSVVNTSSPSGPLHPSLSVMAPDLKQSHSGIISASATRMKLQPTEVAAIRERIMQEMLALEEERMGRMQADSDSRTMMGLESRHRGLKTAEDEQIIRKELNRIDPSAVVFQESWTAKKSRIRQSSPYGHLASWDCVSVIVKTGADLRQEQLAIQMIQAFERIWREENCQCWVRPFQILITGGVIIRSLHKFIWRPLFGQVCSSPEKFCPIKDRHNGNILLDRDGHLIHIDFGFMLSNSPGNIGFEAAPFKLTFDYIEVFGGIDSPAFREFKRLFHDGFEAARKHCDRIITIVELMQKDSSLPCFAALGEQTAQQLRDRFQPKSSQQSAGELVERLIMSSLGSNWTHLALRLAPGVLHHHDVPGYKQRKDTSMD